MEMRSEKRALDKIYKRRDRYEIPDWQRQKVWSADQKRRLVDSIFKPTNKTATALGRLGKALTSLADYQRFIEDLYFVFRESIGQRLDGNLPTSFVHVNDLRTMLQHDVDHGGTAKAAKKRKHLGAVFRGYSGSSSPDAVAPWKFTLVQANILGALKNDLGNLAKSLL